MKIMMKKGNIWLVMALMATLLACKGKTWMETAEAIDAQDRRDFYASENVASAGSMEAQADRQKAKTVVMYEIPAPLKDRPEQILKRKGYTVSYNSETKNPNWVAWHLTKSHTSGSFQRSQEVFAEDTDVKAPRATDRDYYNSRYDRGHMCPAGDNKWDKKAMMESFLFTNVCPQNHGLNKYEWNNLEILCREWAKDYGAVDIVCGPIYSSGADRYRVGKDSQANQKTIGRNKVWVPDAFFKVILCRQGRPKAIGFIYRNEGVKQLVGEAVCSVDKVEELTGIDFFPSLDDKIERAVESEARFSDWVNSLKTLN